MTNLLSVLENEMDEMPLMSSEIIKFSRFLPEEKITEIRQPQGNAQALLLKCVVKFF